MTKRNAEPTNANTSALSLPLEICLCSLFSGFEDHPLINAYLVSLERSMILGRFVSSSGSFNVIGANLEHNPRRVTGAAARTRNGMGTGSPPGSSDSQALDMLYFD